MFTVIVRQGDKYGPEYTQKLKKQLQNVNKTVLILGDGPDANISLKYNLKSWWAKLELFSPEMERYRPLIYLDLDSVVLKPFNVRIPDRLTICREWISGDPKDIRCQSSFMIIPKDTSEIWERFMKDQDTVMHHAGGDQWYLQRFPHDFVQDLYPGLVGSYKFGNKEYPVDKIVTFHGQPKMKDAGWAKAIWNS